MKSFSAALLIVSLIAIGGTILYLRSQKAPPLSAPMVESQPKPTEETPGKGAVPKKESSSTVSQTANASAQIPAVGPTVNEAKPDDSTNAIDRLVDLLLAAKNGKQKQALFDQLRKSGQLDQAIAELQQRAKDNPNDPEIPTTLGEAQLNQLRALRESGNNDYSAIGILAMQADQSFNAALKIDPQNWEAQFVKNASMYYWPANPQMDNQVVQNLSKLIDQQEAMPLDPEFAQTYVVLGNEYQKIGQSDKAQATWQVGLTKFPNDPTLQKKINDPSGQ